MPYEIFYKIKSSPYNEGFFLQEYKEDFYLIAGGEGYHGTNYKKWAYPQMKNQKPNGTAIPISVKLGRRKEAVETLKKILKELRADVY